MLANLDVTRVGAAGGSFVGGLLLGYAVYKLVSSRLRRNETLTLWGGTDFIVAAVRDVAMAWFAIGGLYGAVALLPMSHDARHWLGRALLSLVILSATII